MKIWGSEHIFEHSWETVVEAAWKKYPNPMNPSVTALDVIDRKVAHDGSLLTHRLMTTEWGIPNWVIRCIGMNETCYVSERINVDRKKKIMTLNARNLTFCKYVTMSESLVYSQHSTDPDKTLLKQDTCVQMHGIPMTDYLEGVVKSVCTGNAQKGRQGLEWVISKIKAEAQDIGRAAHNELDNISKLSNSKTSL